MTEYHWPAVRDQAINAFNETPGAELEQDIIDIFQQRPLDVANRIEQLKRDIDNGRQIRSGWAVLRSILLTNKPLADIAANDTTEQTKRVRLAETWIRNTGIHCNDPGDIEDELFGNRKLHPLYTPTLEWLTEFEKTVSANNMARPLLEAAIQRTREEGPQRIPDSENGLLHPWRKDDQLRDRMLALWAEHRPRGIEAETESLAYQEQLRQQPIEAERRRAARHVADQELEPLLATADPDNLDWLNP